ncbi:MAG: hypothetical protein FWG05_04565, partial [Kiritimatiellaeota bacterium]|nr:hypothetical protein [Kiritimatiellota bacterium]
MRRFYDIHMHAMNLSHPNLSAFLFRKDLIPGLVKGVIQSAGRFKLGFGTLLSPSKVAKEAKEMLASGDNSKLDIIANCLAFFEIPLEYQFLVLEYFMKNGDSKFVGAGNKFDIGGETYDKMILCPLVVDFGYKNIPGSVFYNIVPK